MSVPSRLLCHLTLGCLLTVGCGESPPPPSNVRTPLQIRSFDPVVASITGAVGGEFVQVGPMVPEGVDRADWRPTASELASFLEDDLLLIGGRESWTDTAALPSNRTLALDERLDTELIETDAVVTHSHGPDGDHSHRGIAPNPWLDPDLAVLMATSIRDACVRLAPVHQEEFRSNEALWRRRLIEASTGIELAVNANPTRPVLFASDGYQYLQRRYGMNGRYLEWSDVETIDEARLAELESARSTHPAVHLVWPSPPAASIVEALEARGIESVVFPLPGPTDTSVDLIEMIKSGTTGLRSVYDADS